MLGAFAAFKHLHNIDYHHPMWGTVCSTSSWMHRVRVHKPEHNGRVPAAANDRGSRLALDTVTAIMTLCRYVVVI